MAWDDVSGAKLCPRMVASARKEEMGYIKRRKVYSKVKRSSLPPGAKHVRTKWLDINNGDDSAVEIRARLVAMEFKDGESPELFAGTPPVGALRIMCCWAATVDPTGGETIIMTNDVKRAYFYAEATNYVWVELPEEDRTREGRWADNVAKLNMAMYGTRAAALFWQKKVAGRFKGLGFIKGRAS